MGIFQMTSNQTENNKCSTTARRNKSKNWGNEKDSKIQEKTEEVIETRQNFARQEKGGTIRCGKLKKNMNGDIKKNSGQLIKKLKKM